MTLHIDDDCMSLEVDGTVTRVAVRLGYLWRVTGWPRLLSRNEAITALTQPDGSFPGTVAERRAWLPREGSPTVPDRLIRITTVLAVAAVAVAVAAVISYCHAYELVSSHGESGLTARRFVHKRERLLAILTPAPWRRRNGGVRAAQ
jgi:hypothetical protein